MIGQFLSFIDGPLADLCDLLRAWAVWLHRFGASLVGGE